MNQTVDYLFKPNMHWNYIKESTYLVLLKHFGSDKLKIISK